MIDKKIHQKNIDELMKSVEDIESEMVEIQPKFGKRDWGNLSVEMQNKDLHEINEVKMSMYQLKEHIDFFDGWRLRMKLLNAHINEMERRLKIEENDR